MMKRFNKTIAIVLIGVLLNGSAVLAEGNEGSVVDDNILTVEEATDMAIKYSRNLKTMEESLSLAEDDRKDANHDLYYAYEYNEVTKLAVQVKNLDNSIRNYNAGSELEKKNLELSIIEMFYSIEEAENSLELCDKQLEIQENELKLAKVKLELGMISQTDYTASVNSYNKTKTQKETIAISVDDAYRALNKILGCDLNKRYDIEINTEYMPFEESESLETKITKALATTQRIKEKEDSVTVAKYEVDVHSEVYSNEKKESIQNNYNRAVRALEDEKINLRISITNLYNSIQTSEKNYNNYLSQLEQMKKELELKELQLSLGTVTELEVEKYRYDVRALENTIKAQTYTHDMLLRRYENPDLI